MSKGMFSFLLPFLKSLETCLIPFISTNSRSNCQNPTNLAPPRKTEPKQQPSDPSSAAFLEDIPILKPIFPDVSLSLIFGPNHLQSSLHASKVCSKDVHSYKQLAWSVSFGILVLHPHLPQNAIGRFHQ